jgi:hypothetical protein
MSTTSGRIDVSSILAAQEGLNQPEALADKFHIV